MDKVNLRDYEAIVMGCSVGGLHVLLFLLEEVSPSFPLPIIVVQHRSKDQSMLLEQILQSRCRIAIKQADEKEHIERSTVYIAPPDYHLLVEADRTFSLNSDPVVMYSRPSIDVLFESAAISFGSKLIGVLLTGANSDGAAGMAAIKRQGGLTIAQAPEEALHDAMPRSAINNGSALRVWTLSQMQENVFFKLPAS